MELLQCKNIFTLDLTVKCYVLYRKVNIIMKEVFLCVCRIQSGSYLSTGWFTLILAMDMCKEIHIYGMINDTYCK